MNHFHYTCCPSIAKEKEFPKYNFSKPIPEKPNIIESWRVLRKKKNEPTLEEKKQRANCKLLPKQYVPPTEKQKYLFVNDQERLGEMRTSFLSNQLIPRANMGRTLFKQGYNPEVNDMTHGLVYCYENGVAESLGQWRVMTPSKHPNEDELNFEKLNKSSARLDFVNEKEYNIYRKCYPVKRDVTKFTGRRDQTIDYPKDMTFGKRSESPECLYEILTNKEQLEWLKERKEMDIKICKSKLKKLEMMRRRPDTWANLLRHENIHQKLNPPEDGPKEPTKLRRRAQPKISSFWNTDEVVELLHDHPEYEERSKHFSVPALSNLYYNEQHCPESLDYTIAVPGKTPFARRHIQCKQCQALRCTCANENPQEKIGSCEAANETLREKLIRPDEIEGEPEYDNERPRHVHFNEGCC